MKAPTYQGTKDVRVQNAPNPIRLADDKIIVKVIAWPIGGSYLHLYRGKTPDLRLDDAARRCEIVLKKEDD